LFAVVSGLYLLVAGPAPDAIPPSDEAMAQAIFVKSLRCLGYDVTRWLPFAGRGQRPGRKGEANARGVTIDV
jgi:hypothetical protein